jgi:competence protein ComGC
MFVFGERLSAIELGSLAVVVLLSVLLVLGLLQLEHSNGGCISRRSVAERDMIELQQLAEMYQLEHGHKPDSLTQLVESGALREYPVDPWGTDYQAFARPDGRTFVLRCAGPDRIHGTSDDVFRFSD